MSRAAATCLLAACALGLPAASSCGSDKQDGGGTTEQGAEGPVDGSGREAPGPAAEEGAGDRQARDRPSRARLREARCPADAPAGCRSASGRVIYVERVDPDGDGDAHFVLASRESITAPGLSVIDVRRDLRPRPLPGPGDRVSAAGPVYDGSYGQRQIEAVVVHVLR